MSDEISEKQRVADAFRSVLDSHGYGFQYAVLKKAEELVLKRGTSSWFPLLPELPVSVQSRDTRIDLVFEHLHHRRLLVIECKRANPATAYWCFARAPWEQPPFVASRSFFEVVSRTPGGEPRVGLSYLGPTDNMWQIACAVRTGNKGDSRGTGGREIEDAASQLSKGFNGLIELLSSRSDLLLDNSHYELVPAIFTTARLFVSDADLGRASLANGKLPTGDFTIQERDWIWYDYPQSPGIRHSVASDRNADDLRNLLFLSYVRRIAVVSASGIESFLSSSLWQAPSFQS